MGFFGIRRNGTGDLALWWEIARGWRLGRRVDVRDVAARKTRAKQEPADFQSGETSSIPGACVPRAGVRRSGKITAVVQLV